MTFPCFRFVIAKSQYNFNKLAVIVNKMRYKLQLNNPVRRRFRLYVVDFKLF